MACNINTMTRDILNERILLLRLMELFALPDFFVFHLTMLKEYGWG